MEQIAGIIITAIGVLIGSPIVSWVFRLGQLNIVDAPEGIPQNLWDALQISGAQKQGKLLGLLERTVSAIAEWTKSYELIVGLLAFKVASKWEVWSTVLRLPESITNVDEITYLRTRRLWGANLLMRFLIGSLSNVLLGLAAGYVGKVLSGPTANIIISCFGGA